MAGAHQHLEHAEHVTHSGHDHGDKNKHIGVTIAIFGALIAFCSAMVGSERNELTRTMMEQTQAYTNFTAAATKFRLIMLELEKQRGKLAVLTPNGGVPPPNSIDLKVVHRFVELSAHYSTERKISKGWSESYRPLVEAHFDAAESYERAQLIAEFGIVLASLAILLGNQKVWLASLLLAVCCFGQLALTGWRTQHTVQEGLHHVEEVEGDYQRLRERQAASNEDDKTLEALDPGGVIRKAADQSLPAKAGAKPAAAEAASKKE
ncbi:MAG: DUF4337 family protein [Chthoniobacter sp.]